ncbi:MAG: hypothetical protein HYR56_11405 [Acidobacteria bacterium]|nr:hypothetical protein [Acidobacteriota bacterium]MBI3421317.1 hypothetical protein [Acidobacteriota bacterium]
MNTPKPINPDRLPELIEDENSFERFDELARKLLRVSKSEIEERQTEYEQQPKHHGKDPFRNKIIPA